MKWLYTCCLFLFAACQTPPNIDIPGVISETVKAVDRDGDGQVTKEEIRSAKDDPTFWISIGSTLLGLFGIGKAAQANQRAARVQAETDQQWDNELNRLRERSEARIPK